ncbi:hypothetical protein LEA_03076, partial [human gut metagenome]
MKNDQQTYVPDPEVASRLLEWYGREGRDLPWRRTRGPLPDLDFGSDP